VPKETTPQFSNIAIISAPWLLPLQTQMTYCKTCIIRNTGKLLVRPTGTLVFIKNTYSYFSTYSTQVNSPSISSSNMSI